MSTLNRISFILNEIDWLTDIGKLVFNQLLEKQLKAQKHQWFKLDEVYNTTVQGKDLKKMCNEGTVEAILEDHPYTEVKKGYARITKKIYNKLGNK